VKVFGALFASGSALRDGLAHPAPGKVSLPALFAVRRRQALRWLSYPNFVCVDSGQPSSLTLWVNIRSAKRAIFGRGNPARAEPGKVTRGFEGV